MKVLLFIGLKIAELSLIIFAPYYLGMWVHSWTGYFCMHDSTIPSCCPLWGIGLLSLMMAFVVAVGAIVFVYWNLKLVDIIHDKMNGY